MVMDDINSDAINEIKNLDVLFSEFDGNININ